MRLFYDFVYDFLNFGKDCAWRKHFSIFVRTVNPYEFRIEFTLLSIDGADAFLEFDVCFVDVLTAFQIISVGAATLAFELGLHESDRDVEEDVKVRDRQAEVTVLGVEYPVSESV